MNHFTNTAGYNGIRSQPTWLFRAEQPPRRNHEKGAYFTTLGPDSPRLAVRLGIPRSKCAYVFSFDGIAGLRPLRGERGKHILFSPVDYPVERERQRASGPTGLT